MSSRPINSGSACERLATRRALGGLLLGVPALLAVAAMRSVAGATDAAGNPAFGGRRRLEESEKCVGHATTDPFQLSSPYWAPLYAIGVVIAMVCIEVLASDFFVPGFEVAVKRLRISADVAGALLLAAASSSPEVMAATVGTFFEGSNGVGTGTVVGSVVFNSFFITGGIALATPRAKALSLRVLPVIRDGAFFAVAIISLTIVLADSKVMWYEALALVTLYGLYIVVTCASPIAPLIRKKMTRSSDISFPAAASSSAAPPSTMLGGGGVATALVKSLGCASLFGVVRWGVRWILRYPISRVFALVLPEVNAVGADGRGGHWHWYTVDIVAALLARLRPELQSEASAQLEEGVGGGGAHEEDEDDEAPFDEYAPPAYAKLRRTTCACSDGVVVFWAIMVLTLTLGLCGFGVIVFVMIEWAEKLGCFAVRCHARRRRGAASCAVLTALDPLLLPSSFAVWLLSACVLFPPSLSLSLCSSFAGDITRHNGAHARRVRHIVARLLDVDRRRTW